MNFKWQDMLLEELAQDDFGKVALEESNLKTSTIDLKKRKHLVQQLQTNLEGEINSNMTLN